MEFYELQKLFGRSPLFEAGNSAIPKQLKSKKGNTIVNAGAILVILGLIYYSAKKYKLVKRNET